MHPFYILGRAVRELWITVLNIGDSSRFQGYCAMFRSLLRRLSWKLGNSISSYQDSQRRFFVYLPVLYPSRSLSTFPRCSTPLIPTKWLTPPWLQSTTIKPGVRSDPVFRLTGSCGVCRIKGGEWYPHRKGSQVSEYLEEPQIRASERILRWSIEECRYLDV